MNTKEAILALEKVVPNPSSGLPDDVFYYISRTTPLVNVDLLIKDEKGRTILAWRDDVYCGKGWHVPGGIIRFKETFEARIQKVALLEVGTEVEFEKTPIKMTQLIHEERADRGHFISLLYRCFLPGSFVPENKGVPPCQPGYVMWHDTCPDNLLKLHDIYREYI